MRRKGERVVDKVTRRVMYVVHNIRNKQYKLADYAGGPAVALRNANEIVSPWARRAIDWTPLDVGDFIDE